ncbi:hybrid sensor histidine kinase/response regulator [Haloarcula onubensis]|uniref:ATP-binding protein n=1 Tax=Haloarcula onubensis TaxID=2950539 RepID=A0ABU2FNB6_9EURY|nr:ATP-binding protein [Halomicroarcula sp. S3CR25-11]MDS0281752.1 ATP-binding protein [Halomicroarcula sp. S3CR25-11]
MDGTTTKLNVLLVEDNPGDARLVRHYLNASETIHFVDEISLSHVESLSAVEDAEGYDVLLLDLGLPGSTGLETLDRAVGLVDSVPIIVLTGMQNRESAMQSIQRGAQDYLPKSELDGDRLVRTLRYAVERSRQQRTLRRRNDQIEFFNSILRHDMLNGMNVIRARGELLSGRLDGDEREYADTIVRWSDDIIDLTEKVRSVLETLSEDGMTEMERRDLGAVLDDAAERARSVSGDCAVVNHVEDIEVAADELLEDVFGNLFMNAVEHGSASPDGTAGRDAVARDGVTVTVTAAVRDGTVTVRIADDGPGIAPERRRRVFDRGEKGSASSGTGFGLYFVDSMIESYGGRIWVEDSDAGGAAFVVELPRTE